MCGLCELGDAAYVVYENHGSIWPANAGEILASKGLVVEDADALFGYAAPPEPDDPYADISFTSTFDIPSGTSTPFFLGVGQRINAQISVPGDTDWFGMQFVQGQTYQISLRSLPYFGLGDPELYLFDNFGNLLTFDDNSGVGTDALLTVTATRTGLYYIGATGFGGTSQTVGGYEISLARVDFSADVVGQTEQTAGVIQVDTSVTGTIDFGTDEDWFRLSVEKGKTYAVFLDSEFLSFTPLADPKLEVLNRNLKVKAANDDNGITKNAALTFTADYNGDYFIKTFGGPANTGDFRLTVADFTPPEPPSPLDALDWGVEFGKSEITYYFAKAGETFANELTDVRWNNYEKKQAKAALNEYSKVAKLSFTEVNNANNADFILTKNFLDSTTTGRMFPQDPDFGADQGVGWFNTDPGAWSRKAGGFLEKGAYGYSNFIHEFGHGLGLSHPHDNGGTSAVFAGVAGSGDTGDNDLNQEVFTLMSYNKGWVTGPLGSSATNAYGVARTPMAFDIAMIQKKYGATSKHKNGDTTYELWTKNDTGTGYEAIWDTGGKDTIVNPGSKGATIDLREATLKAEPGGGGYVSFVSGVYGGYTIANGVKIENATGGSSGDTLIGNGYQNKLDGGDGRDALFGGKGRDKLNGGKGIDKLNGGKGNDSLSGGKSNDKLSGGNGDDSLVGGKGNDSLIGGKGADDFVFGDDFGKDRIADFAAKNDREDIDLSAVSNIRNFRDLKDNHMSKSGDHVKIDAGGGNVITIEDTKMSQLDSADFLF